MGQEFSAYMPPSNGKVSDSSVSTVRLDKLQSKAGDSLCDKLFWKQILVTQMAQSIQFAGLTTDELLDCVMMGKRAAGASRSCTPQSHISIHWKINNCKDLVNVAGRLGVYANEYLSDLRAVEKKMTSVAAPTQSGHGSTEPSTTQSSTTQPSATQPKKKYIKDEDVQAGLKMAKSFGIGDGIIEMFEKCWNESATGDKKNNAKAICDFVGGIMKMTQKVEKKLDDEKVKCEKGKEEKKEETATSTPATGTDEGSSSTTLTFTMNKTAERTLQDFLGSSQIGKFATDFLTTLGADSSSSREFVGELQSMVSDPSAQDDKGSRAVASLNKFMSKQRSTSVEEKTESKEGATPEVKKEEMGESVNYSIPDTFTNASIPEVLSASISAFTDARASCGVNNKIIQDEIEARVATLPAEKQEAARAEMATKGMQSIFGQIPNVLNTVFTGMAQGNWDFNKTLQETIKITNESGLNTAMGTIDSVIPPTPATHPVPAVVSTPTTSKTKEDELREQLEAKIAHLSPEEQGEIRGRLNMQAIQGMVGQAPNIFSTLISNFAGGNCDFSSLMNAAFKLGGEAGNKSSTDVISSYIATTSTTTTQPKSVEELLEEDMMETEDVDD